MSSGPTPAVASAHEWAQLVDLAITRREVHMEQLQLFVSGALRHPALVNKDGAFLRGSPSPSGRRTLAHSTPASSLPPAQPCSRTSPASAGTACW